MGDPRTPDKDPISTLDIGERSEKCRMFLWTPSELLQAREFSLIYHTKARIDNVFFTCRILHNVLHAFDGLDVTEADVEWAGEEGLRHAWTADPLTDVVSNGARRDIVAETIEVASAQEMPQRKWMTFVDIPRAAQ